MKQLLTNFSTFAPDNASGMNRDWIGNAPVWSRKFFALLVVLLLGVGQMWGYTETLNSTKITTNITNSTQCAYGTPRSAYTDGDVTYTACCNTDAAGRPWMQLRAKNDAYITISLPSTKKITNVSVTISNATNEKGGVTDISKHGNFSGEVVLRSSISNTPGTSPDFTSGSVNAKSASVDVTGSNNTLHLQVTAAARIWGIVVTYQDNASCTSNPTVSGAGNSSFKNKHH